MKKNGFIDNFLYRSFKFGKIFAFMALIALILAICVSSVILLNNSNNSVNTPSFSVVKQAILASENEDNDSYSSSSHDSAGLSKKEIADNKHRRQIENITSSLNLMAYSYDLILDNVIKYDEKYQDLYIKGLKPFLKDGIDFVVEQYSADMGNVSESKNYLNDIIYEYNRLFDTELNRIYSENEQMIQVKIYAGVFLAVCVLLFIICLFLPIFIKIEENTRQLLEKSNKGNNNV